MLGNLSPPEQHKTRTVSSSATATLIIQDSIFFFFFSSTSSTTLQRWKCSDLCLNGFLDLITNFCVNMAITSISACTSTKTPSLLNARWCLKRQCLRVRCLNIPPKKMCKKSGQIIKDFYCAVNNEKRHFTRRKKIRHFFLNLLKVHQKKSRRKKEISKNANFFVFSFGQITSFFSSCVPLTTIMMTDFFGLYHLLKRRSVKCLTIDACYLCRKFL